MSAVPQTPTTVPPAKKRRTQRYASVEVHVSEFVTADVPLSEIKTEDLAAELRERGAPNCATDLNDECAEFSLNVGELRAIRHLYLIGREAEASDRCRVLLADMLGTAF